MTLTYESLRGDIEAMERAVCAQAAMTPRAAYLINFLKSKVGMLYDDLSEVIPEPSEGFLTRSVMLNQVNEALKCLESPLCGDEWSYEAEDDEEYPADYEEVANNEFIIRQEATNHIRKTLRGTFSCKRPKYTCSYFVDGEEIELPDESSSVLEAVYVLWCLEKRHDFHNRFRTC